MLNLHPNSPTTREVSNLKPNSNHPRMSQFPRTSATGQPNNEALIFTPNPDFLSSALPPEIRVPDLERSLILEPGRWDPKTANLVLASQAPVLAVVPVLVTLEQVYAMQELELKQRALNDGIEELNRVLEDERRKAMARGKGEMEK
jgi:hypothetical protein